MTQSLPKVCYIKRKNSETRSKLRKEILSRLGALVGRSRFCLRISRKGVESYPRGHFGAFLVNESEHDVVVDFMISVEGGQSCHENYRMIEKKSDWGWNNLMMVRGVGAKIAIVVEVELKWENISGG